MNASINSFVGKRVFFVGVGGCSMSGLARMMKWLGYEVAGSDRTKSHKTDALQSEGIEVFIGHDAKNVEGASLLIYSAAISRENPERARAAELGIPEIERCDLIGQLMRRFEKSIAISGTHGKTTTTAMMAEAFVTCGEDPSVHIGGELDFLGGSTRLGSGEAFICEACEFNASFLRFFPNIAVILNIDEDHLDFYKDIDDIENAFYKFASLVPTDGWTIGCGDDKRVRNVLGKLNCKTRTYGIEPHNEIRAEQISYDENGCANFIATLFGHPLTEVELKVPGEHNVLNALAVIAAANLFELPMSLLSKALNEFTGAHRRFELTSVTDGVRVYQDYAHNPAETNNVLKVARLQAHKTLWAVLQPHTYSRTKALFNGFLSCFDDADKVLVTDICAAREKDPGDINSSMLVEAMREKGIDAYLTPSFDDAEDFLRKHWNEGDVVVTLGCGDIDLLNEQILIHGDTDR
ncbi:MAG: UDP-N-acetylmuramate--L-alanine ligase [Clostridia bacterium]|nr:UDP-N-acetylmuramate--L-alanine ligase [Clostridia bacterium]MBQ4157434.1 UDP-N-acetylmuramate--L-alanine ligase [Clostridia bacterium]